MIRVLWRSLVASGTAASLSLFVGASASAAQPADGGSDDGAGRDEAQSEPGDDESPDTEAQQAARERAQKLYEAGSASFSAADYEDAIDKFTEMLRIAETSRAFGPNMRSALLLNLARAHRYQYRVDHELKRLRLALEIYERLLRESKEGLYPPEDVQEGEAARTDVIAQIEEHEADDRARAAGSADAGDSDQTDGGSKRGLPIGLVVGGSVLTAAGVGFIVVGTQYGRRAEDEAAGRTDLDQTVIDDFIDEERGKGTAWIIGGAVASAVGVGLLVTGAVILAKQKKKPSTQALRLIPNITLQPGYSSVGLVGRF